MTAEEVRVLLEQGARAGEFHPAARALVRGVCALADDRVAALMTPRPDVADPGLFMLLGEATYRAESWPQERRVVYKAEALAKGPNTRFVVTTRTDDPRPSTAGTPTAASRRTGSRI